MLETENFAANKRREEDYYLVASYGPLPRTRDHVLELVRGQFPGFEPGVNVTTPGAALFDTLYCATARLIGSGVCDACGNHVLRPELTDRELPNHKRAAVCDRCHAAVDAALMLLPAWVKDADLRYLIPALVAAYIREKQARRV